MQLRRGIESYALSRAMHEKLYRFSDGEEKVEGAEHLMPYTVW